MVAKSLLVLGLVALGSAFTLPGGLADGTYRAYINEAGEEVHELVAKRDFNAEPAPAMLKRDMQENAKRQPIASWCDCNDYLDATDTNNANGALQAQTVDYPLIKPGLAFYSIANSVVAYVCNVDHVTANIPTNIVQTGSGQVTSECGLFIGGSIRIQYTSAMDYGYRTYTNGLNFCGIAEEGDVWCCITGSSWYPDCQDS